MVRAGHAHFATIHKFYLAVADDLPDRARRAAEACVRQDLVQSRCSSHFSPENENAEQPRSCQGSFAFLSMLLRTKGARYFVRSVTIHLVGVLRPFGGRRTAYGEKQVRRGSRLAVPHGRWVTLAEIGDELEEKRRGGSGAWAIGGSCVPGSRRARTAVPSAGFSGARTPCPEHLGRAGHQRTKPGPGRRSQYNRSGTAAGAEKDSFRRSPLMGRSSQDVGP